MWLELTTYDQPGGYDGERRAWWFGQGGITCVGPHYNVGAGGGGACLWQDGWEAPVTVRESYAWILEHLGAHRLPTAETQRPIPAAEKVRVLRALPATPGADEEPGF